jgi:hypothetical protein
MNDEVLLATSLPAFSCQTIFLRCHARLRGACYCPSGSAPVADRTTHGSRISTKNAPKNGGTPDEISQP